MGEFHFALDMAFQQNQGMKFKCSDKGDNSLVTRQRKWSTVGGTHNSYIKQMSQTFHSYETWNSYVIYKYIIENAQPLWTKKKKKH